ncbi:YjjG family noncanonical pyrimidine nucleotidase [Vagococcus intermedius]|uniref:YjjG family noncanonical pyrimidine nucleotidase n=1 Tax=Vagococcus intermedius TaxID=2991418 RepID=A0AAF0CVD2_9ENTE|nr:YjjG family noncanonical pyrimidine nucleotidase [Vagococcus intermedius]WEG73551.1 YjjG family noncanonical pyrimidine nucleotidase [Vagococcus intermedius]WEG75633.1 YjjG family noncanonical pyrimidine nucleotidase [Vagococcus intermedius]
MSEYTTILFDVDQTLLDFKQGQQNALRKMFHAQGITMTPELFEIYELKNHDLWAAFEQGLVKREQVLSERFTYIFKKCGLERDGYEMDRLFRGYLKEEAILLPGAFEVIEKLSKKYRLGIVTNGVSETQYRRLEKAELLTYFKEAIFVSEDTGFQKPMPQFFDYVFERLPGVERSETLIVGDSLSADIKGGNLAGSKTCWYNPLGVVNETKIIPTYEIKELRELLQLL